MKVLKKIKSIIIGLVGIAFFAFALTMTILLLNYNKFGLAQFDNTTFVFIGDSLTSDEFKKGDLVLVKSKKLEDIKVGDTMFSYRIDGKGLSHVELGNVGKIYPDEKAISYENGSTYSIDYVMGASDKIYPSIGGFLSIILSTWGFLFIVLVPSFLIFIYEIYALILEIKYGTEENQ